MSGRPTRREFVRRGLGAGLALSPVAALLDLSACTGREAGDDSLAARYAAALRRAEAAGPAKEITLLARTGDVEIGPGRVFPTWLYGGAFPGPEIRVSEGERLRVTLRNELPEPTTVHWHGVPVPNAMDGVPDVTQAPVEPGSTFVYDFVAEPAGTYMYHSHVGLQLDRALVGALVIEERTPHIAYDRDYTLVLDDWLSSDPQPASARATAGMRGMREMMQRMMGGGGGMMVQDPARPEYAALLVNGRTPEDPPTFEVRTGEHVRLRLVNLASATTFRVGIAGHLMNVTHADGRPVEPVGVDALVIGMGERYDLLVAADNPGAWTIVAASDLGTPEPARGVLRYVDSRAAQPEPGDMASALEAGRLLDYGDLRSVELEEARPEPDRRFDLTVSWGMMMAPDEWSIGGQLYPDADPLDVGEGERIRIDMGNMSPIHHPMHLHGHFFRVGRALKDTVMVPAHMGRTAIEFTADNPGDWFFHCHNLYHMEAGMARVFRYV